MSGRRIEGAGPTAPVVAAVDERTVAERIYVVRGRQVMLDFDLAEIYGCTTSRFNTQVKNDAEKFDEGFCFRLAKGEFDDLMSKNSTSSWAAAASPGLLPVQKIAFPLPLTINILQAASRFAARPKNPP